MNFSSSDSITNRLLNWNCVERRCDPLFHHINAQGKGPRGVDYRPLRSLNPNHDNEL